MRVQCALPDSQADQPCAGGGPLHASDGQTARTAEGESHLDVTSWLVGQGCVPVAPAVRQRAQDRQQQGGAGDGDDPGAQLEEVAEPVEAHQLSDEPADDRAGDTYQQGGEEADRVVSGEDGPGNTSGSASTTSR